MSGFTGGGGAGGLVLLASAEPSAASEVDFDLSAFDYPKFRLVLGGVICSTTAALGLRVKTADTWRASGYHYAGTYMRADATYADENSSSAAYVPFSLSVGGSLEQNGYAEFAKAGSYLHPVNTVNVGDDSSPWFRHCQFGGYYDGAGAVQAVRVLPSAGTISVISGGAISLLGVKK